MCDSCLDAVVKAREVEAVAEGIKVSQGTLRSWLRGVRPTESNRKRIEQFLSERESAEVVGAKESAKPGELLGQSQQFSHAQPPGESDAEPMDD